MTRSLLTRSNAKTPKGERRGWITWILYLAPADISGYEVCGGRSKECTEACLYTAGRGQMNSVQQARIRKTKWFFEDRAGFMKQLVAEIKRCIQYAKKKGMKPAFRLNGTSDIPWESIRIDQYKNIFEMFPDVQWYDYTKLMGRKKIPKNYHLTYSRSGANEQQIVMALKRGMNISVVFDRVPDHYMGLPVLDGDEDDLRFLDPTERIVGLKAKGKAIKSIHSNFVIRSH